MDDYPELKKPPMSVEAEKSVLGACLISTDSFDDVADILSPDDFFNSDHRKGFEAMLELREKGTVDAITLADQIGDLVYWGRLVKETVGAKNAVAYAKIIKDRSNRRKVIKAGHEATEAAWNTDEKNYIAIAQSTMMEIETEKGTGPIRAKDKLKGWLNDLEKRFNGEGVGIKSGYVDLDEITHGFKGSQLIVVAGRPKMGKTTFTRCMMEYIAQNSGPVLGFSLEMSTDELLNCCAASIGRIKLDDIESGKALHDSPGNLKNALMRLQDMPLFFDDTPGLDIHSICTRARRMHRRHNLSMVVVDHIGLVHSVAERRDLAIGNVTMGLKNLAKELDIPVIAISQLNRELEKRNNKRPQMSDLRDSGNIEQDADKIIFVYRDEVYDPNTKDKGVAEIIIAAQRAGKTGKIPLSSCLSMSRFDNYEGHYNFDDSPKPKKAGFDG
jgi:replicative DNA helicase